MEDPLNRLARWSKVMISLEELSVIFYKKDQTYEELAAKILELEKEHILQAVKAAGQTMRTPSIAHRYRIDKSRIQDDFYGQLHRYNEQFHPAIRLDRYYSLTTDIFSKDLPFINQIHTYLSNYGLPKEAVPAPERSVELVGDEKWIDTPQLLRIVLQNGDMKVSCRKVTNNNEVTSRSYSWRESNEWSGGEKWSKNMTLFLGILSYVAEKKKLLDTSMKRNRVVVLDNPFGKASSEHVLSPVFFIAEKLGFQMIALTAHAEGKFLRDYFPVMYSCRLRSAQNTEKMIMTKEKTVNAAYFQDNDPAAFERIGESEQLTFLD